MRGIRILCFLVMASLVLSPLAAARQTSTPAAPGPQAKATVKTDAAAAAGAQEAKPAATPAAQKKPAAKKVEEKRTEPILPAYSDIRQRTAVIVFFVWLWFSIAVLIYFLRQWIKEADRVYKSKYYEPEESPRKGNPMAPALGE
jgi:hypothetical protein